MNKRISLGAAIALILVVAAVVFSITMDYATTTFNARVTDLRNREQQYEKFAEIDRLVRLNYYGSIQEGKLMDSVATGYVNGIGDTYATYYSAEEYKKLSQTDQEENVGIGAVIDVSTDDFYLEVLEVYADSPAQVAGIEVGDLIVKIDDTDLTRENSRQMLESINGPQGTQITLVTRRGAIESQPLVMTRRAVQLPTVTSKLLEDSTVGYMRISEFADRTYDQFNRELQKLTSAGATSLVFDLRDNKDASLNLRSTPRILDKLLPEGILISAAYKDGTNEVLATSDANEITLPMVALVNHGTINSAELFAQSIQDFEKGRVVGVTTAGKGVIQEMIKLSDGSAIEVTTAVYSTKSGASFNGTGVKPDFEVVTDGSDWTKLEEMSDTQLAKAKEVAVAMERTIANASSDADTANQDAQPQQAQQVDAPSDSADDAVSDSETAASEDPEASDEADDASTDESSSDEGEDTDEASDEDSEEDS